MVMVTSVAGMLQLVSSLHCNVFADLTLLRPAPRLMPSLGGIRRFKSA
jgi:hypothetical protein